MSYYTNRILAGRSLFGQRIWAFVCLSLLLTVQAWAQQPTLPAASTVCDYTTAPASISLTAQNVPSGYSTVYLLVDMTSGMIVQTNATDPVFSNVPRGSYYAVPAHYKGILNNAQSGKLISDVFSSDLCLTYGTSLGLRVCPATPSFDYAVAPASVTFTTNSVPTGVSTSYALVDVATNLIAQVSTTPAFPNVLKGEYAITSVHYTGSLTALAAGNSLYGVTTQNRDDGPANCLSVSNTLYISVCTSPVVITGPPNNGVVATTTPTISGTAPPGSSVTVTGGLSGGPVVVVADPTTGVWSTSAITFPTGPTSVSATDGTTNAVSNFTVAPTIPPTVAINSPSPNTIVSTSNVPVSGTATPGSTVVLTDGTSATLCTTTATAGGSYSCLVTLTPGSNTITATASNTAGSATTSTSVTAIAPPTVAINSPNNTTATTTPTISGTATPNAVVTLTASNGSLGGPVSVTADNTGAYSTSAITFPTGLASVTAVASNAGGTSSPATTSFTVVALVSPPSLTVTSPVANTSTSTTPVIAGSATPGSVITITGPTGATLCSTTATSGTFACVLTSPLPAGPTTLTVTASGPGGTTSLPVAFTAVDTPTIVILSPANSTTQPAATNTVSGTASLGSTVVITTAGGSFPIVINPTTGAYLLTGLTFTPGVNIVTAVATNAGGTATATSTFTIVGAPTVAVNNPVANGTIASTNPPISGTATPGSSVTVTGGPNSTGGPVIIAVGPTGIWSTTALSFPTGPNTITVVAGNAGGTSSPAVISFTSVGAPTIAIVSPATGTTQPAGTSVVSGTATPNSTVILTASNGNSATITMGNSTTYSVNFSTAFITGVNTVTAVATNAGGTASTTSSFTIAGTTVPAPDLVSSVGPVPPLTVGQTASLPVSVSNVGNGTAAGPVSFVTTLPVGITAPATFTSTSGWGCVTTGQSVSCSTPNSLSAGNSTGFVIPITPTGTALGTTPVFTGTPSTATPESNTANNAAPAVSPAQPVQPAPVCAGLDCGNGVRYGLRLSPDGATYTVYMKSANTYLTTSNQSRIATAQVTLNVPTGTQITSVTSLQPGSSWNATVPVVGPAEAGTRDYRSFGYSQTVATALFSIPANVEIPLFSFQRAGACSGEIGLWDGTDPFQGVSTMTNPGNQMTILGNGTANAWTCNYTCPVACSVPVLALVKQAPGGITQNAPFSYTFTVSNTGNGPTSGLVTVTDVLPAGLTYLGSSGTNWGCSVNGQTVLCTTTAPISASGSSVFTLNVNPVTIGNLANSATVSGGGSTTTMGSQPCATCPVGPTQGTVSAQASDLLVGIQLPTVIAAGQSNTLVVTLTNLLAGTAPGPQSVSIALPNGVSSPASFSLNGGWGCSTTGQSVVCSNPISVSQGQVLSLAIPFTPANAVIGSSLLFTASAGLASNETNAVNNFASVFTGAVAGSDLAVSFGTLPVLSPGQAGIIPITVRNDGPVTVSGSLTLTVSLPAGVSLNAGALPTGWSLLSSGTGPGGSTLVTLQNSNAGGLATNGSLNLNLPVLVQTGVSGTAPFSATIAPAVSENNLANNVSSAATTIGAPDLIVMVTGPNPAFVVSQASSVLITVMNTGTAPATGPVSTTLTLPAGYTTSTANLPMGWSVGSVVNNANGSTTLVLLNNAATITPGQSLTVSLPITPGAVNANVSGTIVAVVGAVAGEINIVNNTGSLIATPTAPGINATVTLPTQFTVGQSSPVSISFVNNGTSPYMGPITTQVTLPGGATIGTLSPGWVITGQITNPDGTVTYTLSNPTVTLAIGGSTVLVVSVTPGSSLGGQTLTVTVVTPVNPAIPGVTGSTSQTVPVVGPSLPNVNVVIGVPSPVFSVGQTSILPIAFTNTGSGVANGPVSTTISLPAGLSVNPAQLPAGWVISGSTPGPNGSTIYVFSNPTGSIAANGGTLVLNLPIAVGQAATGTSPTITVVIQPAGQVVPGSGAYVSPVVTGPTMVLTVGQPTPVLTVGQTSNITVTVQNTGNGPALGSLTAQVVLPAGVLLNNAALNLPAGWVLSSSVAGANGTTVLTFTNANAGGFGAGSLTQFTVPVIPNASTAGTLPSFTITLLPVQGQTAFQQQILVAAVAVQNAAAADLTISAAQPMPNLTVGQAASIAVTIQNIGNATAGPGLSFQIAMPVGLALNALPAGWVLQSQVANGSGGITYTIANSSLSIAAGSSASVNLSVTPGATLANAILSLGLYVNGATGETNLANNGNTLVISTSVQPTPTPDLAVSIPTQSFTLAVNQGALVSFNVANIGSAATTGSLALQFTMPAGFTTTQSSFMTGGWSCATTGSSVNCFNAGGLGINASSALSIPVLPTALAGGLINPSFGINVVQTAGETILANNTGQINYIGTVLAADLAVSFPAQSFTLSASQTSSISLVVSNVSAAANAAGPLSLTFAMPAGFATATSSFFTSGWGCTLTGSTVSCTSAAGLSAGASVTLVIPVVPQVANLVNPTFAAVVAPVPGETLLANNVAQLNYVGTVLPGNVQLAVKMLLQGSFDTQTGLMYDKLRAQNKLPLTQPYLTIPLTPTLLFTNGSQNLTTTPAVLSVTGANAIVDWVMVELRSAGNPASVLAATPALVQRDGDVVSAADGVSSLVFPNLAAGSYYVSVRHRNHLGAMSATALPLSASVTTMDFTQAANVYVKPGAGSYPQHLEGSKAMLWAGNTNDDAQVIFQGNGNDIDPVFFRVIGDGANTGQIANFIAQGYDVTDVNMDGTTIFQGPLNEVDLIFFNIVNHPANPNFLGNFIIQQHLP